MKIFSAIILFLSIFLMPSLSFSMEANEVTTSLGMVNIGFSENESGLVDKSSEVQATEVQSGAISIISLNISYDIPATPTRSYFIQLIVPLMAGDAVFMGGGGANFYFGTLSSKIVTYNDGSKFVMAPQWRYYAGGQANLGYLVYSTETARKSDVLFEIAAHGGIIYNIRTQWAMKAEISMGRGVGVATTTTNMKVFFGGTYDFN